MLYSDSYLAGKVDNNGGYNIEALIIRQYLSCQSRILVMSRFGTNIELVKSEVDLTVHAKLSDEGQFNFGKKTIHTAILFYLLINIPLYIIVTV